MTWVLLLPLLAAVLHAGWNALVKTATDRLTTLAAIALVTALSGALALPFVVPPAPASWALIGASALLHYAYYVLVYYAYRSGDLSLVYPLARGVSPLLIAFGAALFAGETLSLPAQAGVVVASLGICGLSWNHLRRLRGSALPVGLAVATGLVIAAYSVCDGIGIRLSQSPFGYMAWLFLAELPVAVVAGWRRRAVLATTLGKQWRTSLLAGLSSALAYGLVLYAAGYAPLSIVSALRETSVIAAALIGTLLMGERPWQDRVAASVAVAGGVALMTAFR
jgi:drug/metabolite transporter (DMT)-like permease